MISWILWMLAYSQFQMNGMCALGVTEQFYYTNLILHIQQVCAALWYLLWFFLLLPLWCSTLSIHCTWNALYKHHKMYNCLLRCMMHQQPFHTDCVQVMARFTQGVYFAPLNIYRKSLSSPRSLWDCQQPKLLSGCQPWALCCLFCWQSAGVSKESFCARGFPNK